MSDIHGTREELVEFIGKQAAEIERLRVAGNDVVLAVERQLAMHGKGINPSDRLREAIATFRALTK